jgi:hypothetical protein
VKRSGAPTWARRMATASLPLGLLALLWFGADFSTSQAAAAFGLYALCVGAFAQLHRPTTPGSRRVFAGLFVATCVGVLVVGHHADAQTMMIAIASVGGWTVGLGLAAGLDPKDSAPVERSFSGQVTHHG